MKYFVLKVYEIHDSKSVSRLKFRYHKTKIKIKMNLAVNSNMKKIIKIK